MRPNAVDNNPRRGILSMQHRLGVIALCGMGLACSTPAVHNPTPPSPSPASPAPASPAPIAVGTTASATIRDGAGARIGTATFTDTYSGVLVTGSVSGIGLGAHGIHIHEVGKCEPPFASAGGHFNPAHRHHGFRSPEGPHLGDLPNIDMPAAGQLHFEFVLPGVTLTGTNAMLAGNGTAIVIHGGRDDYATDPAGASGARIACGVISQS
jgi:Cu-Zn family superoxide dismutase